MSCVSRRMMRKIWNKSRAVCAVEWLGDLKYTMGVGIIPSARTCRFIQGTERRIGRSPVALRFSLAEQRAVSCVSGHNTEDISGCFNGFVTLVFSAHLCWWALCPEGYL